MVDFAAALQRPLIKGPALQQSWFVKGKLTFGPEVCKITPHTPVAKVGAGGLLCRDV